MLYAAHLSQLRAPSFLHPGQFLNGTVHTCILAVDHLETRGVLGGGTLWGWETLVLLPQRVGSTTNF